MTIEQINRIYKMLSDDNEEMQDLGLSLVGVYAGIFKDRPYVREIVIAVEIEKLGRAAYILGKEAGEKLLKLNK